MKMQKVNYKERNTKLHVRLYKLCVTACVAMMLGLFLFACGSARESSTTTDSAANVIQDTSGAMRDTATSMPQDTSHKLPPDSVH